MDNLWYLQVKCYCQAEKNWTGIILADFPSFLPPAPFFPPQASSFLSSIILKLLQQQMIRTRKVGWGEGEGKGSRRGKRKAEGLEELRAGDREGYWQYWSKVEMSFHTETEQLTYGNTSEGSSHKHVWKEFIEKNCLFKEEKVGNNQYLMTLLWWFADLCKAVKNLSPPLWTFPAKVEQGNSPPV